MKTRRETDFFVCLCSNKGKKKDNYSPDWCKWRCSKIDAQHRTQVGSTQVGKSINASKKWSQLKRWKKRSALVNIQETNWEYGGSALSNGDNLLVVCRCRIQNSDGCPNGGIKRDVKNWVCGCSIIIAIQKCGSDQVPCTQISRKCVAVFALVVWEVAQSC